MNLVIVLVETMEKELLNWFQMVKKRVDRVRVLAWFGVILGLVVIVSLTRNIIRLIGQGGRLQQAKDRVSQLEEEKKELESQKAYYQSDEFVEEEARNRLNMSRPGEAVIVLPSPGGEANSAQAVANEEPIWRKWARYFLKR